jgi:hypothetical protein
MGLREDLLRKIEKKKQEIASLEAQKQQALAYLQALDDTLKLLPRDGSHAEGVLRVGGSIAKARDVLRKHGSPMHVTELLKALGRPVDRVNRSGLSGSIGPYVRRGEIFTRPAPNTYGLVEFSDSEMEIEPDATSPPLGFGKD